MKALVLEALNQPPVFQEVETPYVQPSDALVRIRAAALNHRDVWIMQGQYPGIHHPLIPGSDGMGIVEAVGNQAENQWVDKAVVLNPSLDWGPNLSVQSENYTILGLPRNGTHAEFVTVPVANLVTAPAHLSPSQAAALPLAGLTAWRALRTRAQLQPGERVLVTGIGGGVALFGLQIARAMGCEVWVSSSSEAKIERAVALGAAGGVLYTQTDWHKQLIRLTDGGVDVVLDGAGGPGMAQVVDTLRPGGRVAFYGGTAGKWDPIVPQKLFWKQASLLGSTMGNDAEFADWLAFVGKHKLEPVLDSEMSLSEGAQAYARMAQGGQFGKLVLRVD
jgi:NADPH:quinone reductase-like Zn-dependent oxidoreductase